MPTGFAQREKKSNSGSRKVSAAVDSITLGKQLQLRAHGLTGLSGEFCEVMACQLRLEVLWLGMAIQIG
jgi:hypothetical protein